MATPNRLKVYQCVVGKDDTFSKRVYIAHSTKGLYAEHKDEGEFIQTKDVTDQYAISLSKLDDALESAGFNEIQMQLIKTALESIPITK